MPIPAQGLPGIVTEIGKALNRRSDGSNEMQTTSAAGTGVTSASLAYSITEVNSGTISTLEKQMATLENSLLFLRTMQGIDASLRTNITSGTITTVTTVATVTTVTTLTGQTNIGGWAANMQVPSTTNIGAEMLRSKIDIA